MLDSCGTSGTGETPQERKRRGGSPPAPRKASILERKSPLAIATMFTKTAFKLKSTCDFTCLKQATNNTFLVRIFLSGNGRLRRIYNGTNII